jgi:hypothetical protein
MQDAHGQAQSERTSFDPVGVLEEDGLRRALLAAACVGVLVAHPRYVVRVGHIWAQNLPIEACVFQEHLRAHAGDTSLLTQ